ncbi:MAG: rod shape-determining protein MreD [Chloroflexi bacterium OLB15]|nr:MAG: rod shape-determining protein MreD [Chloroflexi bacterium OLB15]
MGNWFGLPLLVLAAIIQVTFVPQIRLLGGEPNFVMLLVISYAVRARLEESVVWAFIGGLLLDLMTSLPTGASVVSLLLIVFLIDQIRSQLAGVGFLAIIGLVIAGTLTMQFVALALTILSGYNVRLFETLSYVVLPSIAYNLVLVWPVYFFVRRFCRPPVPVL